MNSTKTRPLLNLLNNTHQNMYLQLCLRLRNNTVHKICTTLKLNSYKDSNKPAKIKILDQILCSFEYFIYLDLG